MWLDSDGRMLGRVLLLDGVPPLPHPTVLRTVREIHAAFVADAGEGVVSPGLRDIQDGRRGHLPGGPGVGARLQEEIGALPSVT